jgi:hypothetical protein
VAEGIASGRGATFYAGDLIGGDIFRGSFRRGTAERLIDAPEGRMAVGMKFDRPSGLLFVAGGAGGLGYVYDVRTGDTVASYQLTGVRTRSSTTSPSPVPARGSPTPCGPSCTSFRSARVGSPAGPGCSH